MAFSVGMACSIERKKKCGTVIFLAVVVAHWQPHFYPMHCLPDRTWNLVPCRQGLVASRDNISDINPSELFLLLDERGHFDFDRSWVAGLSALAGLPCSWLSFFDPLTK
jgi:hypothetical protein